MIRKCKYLISLIKQRKEKDNISVILIKSFNRKYASFEQKIFSIKNGVLISTILVIVSIVLAICGILNI